MTYVIRNFFIALREVFVGTKKYYCWIGFLLFLVLLGASSYVVQFNRGLITTAMRDQVSWGFYISNFTYLVGVAAAAVLLVIPAYLYNFKPIKEIVLFGELLAITAITMCLLFVMADMGQPLRAWHILPVIGKMHFPASLLAWDVVVLNGYLAINTIVAFYVLYRLSIGKEYKMSVIGPLILLSIPWAVSIHTVTAFLYNGLSARPFWNASILAPRFLASAFCSGPSLMILLFQIIRKFPDVEIENRALFKIAELVAYAMGLNLFLLGAEVFKEFYSGSIDTYSIKYLYFGLHGKTALVPWIWFATVLNISAFFMFLFPRTRENFLTLNMSCIFIIIGVYIEKGMGLVVPGFVPDTLGEIYEYAPTRHEVLVAVGIWATGALVYTLLLKFAIPIYTGRLRFGVKKEGIPARQIMTKKLVTVTPEVTIEEVSGLLISRNISAVPVVDKDNKVIGVVSESDIIFNSDIKRDESHVPGITAADIMTSPAVTALQESSLEELKQIIIQKKIRRVIIVDSSGHPIGIISRGDILKILGK
ncbi:MAG TPA: NrfD/PsrC family molybdoenzyme membrane anchor subunit [Dissulfurispiraceae bacterium]|nr:NrfD/PsrC family molybdoenzyme membrane anchor subunit [Dissulfurispiraceae bacterium]